MAAVREARASAVLHIHIITHGDVLGHKLGNFIICWGDDNVKGHVSRAAFAIPYGDGEVVRGGF